MKKHIEDMGELAKYTHALDGFYQADTYNKREIQATIQLQNDVIQVSNLPNKEYLEVGADRRLSRIDGFYPTNSVEIVNAEGLEQVANEVNSRNMRFQ